jgi:4-methyl-5(b-hydroxyethyl)-thiazole monophosphate biosynthesis
MRLFIPVAEGFEDIEVFTVVDVMRRAGISIDTVGVSGSVVTSSNGVRIMVDKKMLEIKAEDYDGIIIPGGGKAVDILKRTNSLLEIIKRLDSKQKLIAAICAAPTILAKLGVLEERKATVYPGLERELPKPRDDKVVVDKNIITSQGPGTAIEFALKIVEVLKGEGKANQIKNDLIA